MDETPGPIDRVTAYYERLNPRERKLVTIWLVAIVLFATAMVGRQVIKTLNAKEDAVIAARDSLDLIERKRASYLAAQGGGSDQGSLDERINTNSLKLTTFLDKEASKYDLKIDNFKESSRPASGRRNNGVAEGPTEESVQISIEKADYTKFVRFLDSIAGSRELILIKRIDVDRQRRGRNKDTIRVNMIVSTFKNKEEG